MHIHRITVSGDGVAVAEAISILERQIKILEEEGER